MRRSCTWLVDDTTASHYQHISRRSSFNPNPHVGSPARPPGQPAAATKSTATPAPGPATESEFNSSPASHQWPGFHSLNRPAFFADRMEALRTRPQRMGNRKSGNESAFFVSCHLLRVFTLFSLTQARIALLEGERRSFENVKLDLMRRIKMLEYALRMERSVSFHRICVGTSQHVRFQVEATHATYFLCSAPEICYHTVANCSEG